MTAESILMDALRASTDVDTRDSLVILNEAIMTAIPVIRRETLDAFNEGEHQGFDSASLDSR